MFHKPMSITKSEIQKCLKEKKIPDLSTTKEKKLKRILNLLFKIEQNPTEEENETIKRVFYNERKIIPELMTVHRKIHKNRIKLLSNLELILKLKEYKYIRTYATFVSPEIKVKLLQTNKKHKNKLASAFIHESIEFVKYIPINMLNEFIASNDSFILVVDFLLEKCLKDHQYLDLLGGYIRKYPTQTNLDKLSEIEDKYSDFVENVRKYYLK